MTSSRIILAALGLFFLVLIVLSSSRIIQSIRNKLGLNSSKEQIQSSQISVTPSPLDNNIETPTKPVTFEGKEIPGTGPLTIVYVLLGGGLFSGVLLRQMTSKK